MYIEYLILFDLLLSILVDAFTQSDDRNQKHCHNLPTIRHGKDGKRILTDLYTGLRYRVTSDLLYIILPLCHKKFLIAGL